MTKNQSPKSERLPKVGDPKRLFLIKHLTEFTAYKESIAKGIRLFTRDELEELKDQYKGGILWEDIEREFAKKGIPLKKATFRKYIQDEYISKPISYRNSGRTRVALFAPDTISQLNFIYYFYKIASGEIVDNLFIFLDTIFQNQPSHLDKVEAALTSSDSLSPAVMRFICFSDGEAYSAIDTGLSRYHDDQQKALKMLDEIDDLFNKMIMPKINDLLNFLETTFTNVE